MVGDLFYFYSRPLASCNHTYMYLFPLHSLIFEAQTFFYLGWNDMDTQLVTAQVISEATI